jgi:hypothetical protein
MGSGPVYSAYLANNIGKTQIKMYVVESKKGTRIAPFGRVRDNNPDKGARPLFAVLKSYAGQ